MEKLNKEQLEAVTYKKGPLLIIAGAGTGKTTVITQKIAWLIEQGLCQTQEILALTFTEKAAEEMEERVDRLLPMGYLDLWISTFHSFCERILRQEGLEIGLSTDFELINTSGQWSLVKKNLDKFNLDYYKPLGNPTKFIHAMLTHFSRAKDENISPKEYLKYAENIKLDLDGSDDQEVLKINEVAEAYRVYQQLLLENNYLDFGDLINYTLKLFQKRPQILKKYQNQFKYILVDEFQDTNWAQYELIKILAAPRNNLTVVGDDDQAIFRFRGASMSNILQFKKDYQDSKNIVLVNNYRTKQEILDKAYDFIKLNNPNRLEVQLSQDKLDKKLISHNDGEAVVENIEAESLEEEVGKVVKKIIEIKNKESNLSWNDFAILIRANQMASNFIPVLERANIPYIFLASRGLYAKPVIMNIIAYLKLLDNYHESKAVYRILNLPVFKFNQQEISNINYWAKRKTLSLYETLKEASKFGLEKETLQKINKVLSLIERHTVLTKERGIAEIILLFLEDSGYLKYLTEQDEQKVREDMNYLNQFYRKVKEFEQTNDDRSVNLFLEELNMEIDSGEQGTLTPDYESGPEAIKILTVHGAKGLEFEYVFVVNLVDKRFPTIERRDPILLPDDLIKEILPEGDVHLEEERRLFYVAMTRAKKGLFFSWGKDYGGMRKKKPSRFLIELDLINNEIGSQSKNDQLQAAKIEKREDQNKKQEYPLPKHFSFSQLAAYDTCPKQYYYNFILKVPVHGKAQFSFGRAMHKTFERMMETIISRSKEEQTDLFSKGKTERKKLGEIIELKEIIEIYKASWVDDWFEDKKSKEDYFKKGREILREFYEKYKEEILSPLYLEKGFKFKVSADYSFKGVIDRIDEVDGGIKIIDYKTGSPKEKLSLKDKKQLLIYQLAGADIFEKPIKSLSFYYLDNNSEVEFLGTEKELEKVEKSITETIEKINSGCFEASPGRLCDYCDFKEICEK